MFCRPRRRELPCLRYYADMNTPAHVAASLFVWRKEETRHASIAVCLGALLPDAPMYVFYAVQKMLGRAEQEIWSTQYFRTDWQLFFDVFNSIPLAAGVLLLACWQRWRLIQLGALSCLLHLLLDLPVHHDDAHRHFLPLTNWRFASPISYWDPQHHGRVFMVAELVAAILASLWVARKSPIRSMRRAAVAVLCVYSAAIALAAWLLWG